MSTDRKRKGRSNTTATFNSWSRFRFRSPLKVVVVEQTPEQGARSASDSSSADKSGTKESYRKRFGRTGSAILSILFLRKSKVHDMPAPPGGGVQPVPSYTGEARRVSAPHTLVNSMVQLPAVYPPEARFSTGLPGPFVPRNASMGSGYVSPIKRRLEKDDDGDLRRTCSSPGFTERIANKITGAFSPPTVIHRPESKIRTGLDAILFNPQLAPFMPVPSITTQIDEVVNGNAGNISPSSSIQSNGINILASPATASTTPTSDNSSILSRDANNRLTLSPITETGGSGATSQVIIDPPRDLIADKPIQYRPSIVTVEAAATAKIFFETYFSKRLSGDSPRQQRQREFEYRLAHLPMTTEEKTRARQLWQKQETDYLRQDRVLKSKADFRKNGEATSVAGYEVIKCLGKGSFGVVRLVREKTVENENDAPRKKNGDSREETTHSRHRASSAMGALRAAVDGSRRRELHNSKKEVYAMKVIRKSDMIRNCQEGHLRAERDFLVAAAKSRWVVSLIASFQDEHHLYLVMDYMVGGDFLGLLIRKNILSEDVTRFYIAEMILCVEEAHRLMWIHRDVKPDNFLISASGHLKISDFGLAFDGHWSHSQAFYMNHRETLLEKLGIHVEGDLEDKKATEKEELEKAQLEEAEVDQTYGYTVDPASRKVAGDKSTGHHKKKKAMGPRPGESILTFRDKFEKRKLAKSVVGTSQYMAPEVIRGELYDGRCDWWSIGIILYECLYGFTPFASETRHDTKLKILKHTQTLRFPVESSSERLVSAEAIDLIEQILQEKEYRLCSKQYVLNDYDYLDGLPYTQLINSPPDKKSWRYRGYFVYPQDAQDIKAHPFFRGMSWNDIHLRRPPFVPKVKGWEDTRYFDDDNEPVSDIAANSSIVESEARHAADKGQGLSELPANKRLPTPPPSPKPCPMKHVVTTCRHPCVVAGAAPPDEKNKDKKEKGRRKKEKKRPRDKVLRDDELAEKALKIRKRGAFLGYAYRRPRDVFSEIEIERGRSLIANRDYS